MEKTYHSSGVVLGNYWGGGSGSYGARKFSAPNKKALIKANRDALKSGSLDSGMGYESLIGALIDIKVSTTISVKGKSFTNVEHETMFIGKLKDSEKEFLEEVFINS